MPAGTQGTTGGGQFQNDTGSTSIASRVVSTYTTFSGIDITAIFDNLVLATLSGIATSLTREKVPVFTFGSADARSISRGKRACAGSLQFTIFDRDAFYSLFLDESHFYYAHANEISYLTDPVNPADFTGLFFQAQQNADDTGGFLPQGLGLDQPGEFAFADAGAGQQGVPVVGQGGNVTPPGTRAGALSVRRAAQHADQVYPFDITLIAQNEYGRAATCAVIGVEIINEGGGMSVDDITNEQQMTYIAITRLPWIPLTSDKAQETLFGRITSLTNRRQNADGTTSVSLGRPNQQVRTVDT